MDKNSWIGLGLIALILIGFSFFNRPSKQELERRQRYQDSIAIVQQQKIAEQEALQAIEQLSQAESNSPESASAEQLEAQIVAQYGPFAPSAKGSDDLYTVENDLLKLVFSQKGGTLYSAELKNYKSYGDTINPLCLFRGDESHLDYTLVTNNNRILTTSNLYFTPQPIVVDTNGAQILTLRLLTDGEAYLDFVYTIPKNNYMLDFSIRTHNMQNVLAQNVTSLEMRWYQKIPQHERGRKFEERYAQLQYMFTNRDMEKLSEQKSDRAKENGKIRWIAYKDQFFSTVMIAEDAFEGTTLESNLMSKYSGYVKEYQTTTAAHFDLNDNKNTDFRIYLGPNHYNTLKAYDKDKQRYEELCLKELVPLGWKIVAWVNKILVIPMFDLFTSWGMHIGWIILLMTLVIKLIIFPFTFTSYRSSAMMRALKPQIEEINAKYPPEKMQERQQATMALYRKAGANPMAGCLPMLFQFPVVVAMFWFFPTAIELRGQSFLWADDLSTYDAILSWDKNIPIISWLFDNHLSLFCLLFTGTNLLYTYLSMQTQATGNDPSAKMMKWMMYLMPLFFFFVFNDYAAGLSYYYFLSLLFSILQTMIFRWTLDDKKMLERMTKKQAKKAAKPKSGFMQRLENMQREQQKRMKEQVRQQSKQYRK